MIKGFKSSNIYVYGKGVLKTNLSIENGTIKEIGDALNTENFIELEDKFIVIPGFVDKHTHGANGSDFMNPNHEALKNITLAMTKEGTTSCLATTMTESKENINKALNNISSFMNLSSEGAEILGIHLEGPFVSPKFAGAQPHQYIIPCDVHTFEEFNLNANGRIKQVTLACEENGSSLIEYLVKKGVIVSLGHSACTYLDAKTAIDQGASSITHTFNAMSPLHHRDIGLVGAALYEDVSTELICDLIHVSKPAVSLLYKNKSKHNICLITDSMEAKYMPDGLYKLGGQDVYVKNTEARLKDGTLAGSTLKMNEAVRNFMNTTGIDFTEAIDCATIYPAKCIHVEDRKGSIEVGKDADFTIVDKDFNVYMTICKGKMVYSKN